MDKDGIMCFYFSRVLLGQIQNVGFWRIIGLKLEMVYGFVTGLCFLKETYSTGGYPLFKLVICLLIFPGKTNKFAFLFAKPSRA